MRSLRAAASATLSIRAALVVGRTAVASQPRSCLRVDAGKAAKFAAAGARLERAGQVVGDLQALCGVQDLPRPVGLRPGDGREPAGAILPSAVSRSTRALFVAAQTLRGFRGAK